MTIVAAMILMLATSLVVIFLEMQRKRWPQARRISIFIIGIVAVVIAVFGLVGTFSDAVSGSTVHMTQAGSRSFLRIGENSISFWFSIALQIIAGLAILWAGLNLINMSIAKKQ